MGEQTPQPLRIPYRELGFGGARPYVFLHVTGLDGVGRMIPGLIDSGADSTVLPAGYAPLLGYSRSGLERVEGSQVGGSVTLLYAKRASSAYVPEFPERVFEMAPFFVHGCQHALWGRADLMLSATLFEYGGVGSRHCG